MRERAVPRLYRVRARLGAGLFALVLLALLCAALVALVADRYRGARVALDRGAALARAARSLGVFAREQYIHEAHTIILADRSHVGHHGEWVAALRARAAELRAALPEREQPRVSAIVVASAALEDVFAREILPAVDRGDTAAVRAAHGRAEALVDAMTRHADALGDAFEQRAHGAAAAADRAVRAAAGLATVIAALAGALAVLVARGVWGALASPLGRLQSVAERVAAGESTARVGALRAAELRVVSEAFDAMLDRLARREAALVEAERLAVLGRIAAGVAHEINNPIGVIRGYLGTMRAELGDDERSLALRDELAILDEEAAACQRIAEDLLTYARAPALARERVDVPRLVLDVLRRFDATGELEGARVRATEVEEGALDADPLRLRQVLANLLRNAAQASAGGAELELRGRVDASASPPQYDLEVCDRGAGLAPSVREHLFEPFAAGRAGGTGLGLAVCDAIVRAHGGTLRASDREGGGTVFTLRLPCAPEPSAREAA